MYYKVVRPNVRKDVYGSITSYNYCLYEMGETTKRCYGPLLAFDTMENTISFMLEFLDHFQTFGVMRVEGIASNLKIPFDMNMMYRNSISGLSVDLLNKKHYTSDMVWVPKGTVFLDCVKPIGWEIEPTTIYWGIINNENSRYHLLFCQKAKLGSSS